MKLVTKLVCAAVLAMPLVASAFTFINSTPYDMSFTIGRFQQKPTVAPYSSFTFPKDKFIAICATSPQQDCVLNLYSAGFSTSRVLLTVLLNLDGEVVGVKNVPANKKVYVLENPNHDINIVWDESKGRK